MYCFVGTWIIALGFYSYCSISLVRSLLLAPSYILEKFRVKIDQNHEFRLQKCTASAIKVLLTFSIAKFGR